VQLKIANLYLIEGNPTAALEVLGAAVKTNPRSGYAHFLRGQALLRTGDLRGAEQELTLVASASPSSADVQTWLGLLRTNQRDITRAREAFDRAQSLQPTSPVALVGQISGDLAVQNYDAARAKVESALRENPRDARLLVLAANTYVAVADLPKAEATYKTLLEVDPNNIEAFTKLGVIYHTQRRLEEAKRAYQELASHHARPFAAMTFLGMLYEMQNNIPEAKSHYQRALEIEPRAAVAANNLAWIYAEADENLDLALELAQTAKAELPNSPEVNDTLGWVYYKRGLGTLAVTFLEEASRQGPPSAGTHYRLGLAYVKNGDTVKGRASLEQALKLNPTFEHADDARRALAEIKG
jgi:tetratricopeptide (TPR) repeat protein